ncbi:DUF2892 domain-containing protein [Pseudorhizobium flavum]|uniref:Inner membrane protein YgaP-like transmembrane domain-containing protein n=2 Tax=Pseudorhizobium flavum TaxID=1335061 RepID=A0A7W9YUG6_9HYPH|nr:DUF2892 domain-containing protein [Pseudorhizobium flavum]MBB6178485.1 hypothetical protein [Pseudorhizobium flavum]CAD6611173.1 hypothetical protein RFYW14_02372 [Pseudorhizobium flavum]
MFAKNVGSADRIIRVVAGILLLSLFFIYPESPWRYFALIGIVPLATGLLATCPLYSLFGISSCPMKKVR